MGKRGPKPRPKARTVKLVAGTDVDAPGELPPGPGDDDRPEPPKWLTPLALAEWRRVEHELWLAGNLSAIDRGMFAAYCQAWGRYEQGEIDLSASIAEGLKRKTRRDKTHGAVVKTKAGNQIMNPLFGLVNTLRRDMQRLAGEFGLSPSARGSMSGAGAGAGVRKRDAIAEKYFGPNG